VWTTTPWTLVSNAAVAVDPDLTYVRTTDGNVLAEALVTRVLGEDVEIADRFHGRDMLGAAYEPPFGFIATEEFGPKGHTVLPATSSPPRTEPGSCTRRSRSARTTSGSAPSRA
jgi:isoleucyl-tRNA synthetase